MKYAHAHRGFTVFFAILVSSLALAIGVAIYDVVSRELILSQVSSESHYAIFASDSGAECALFWDNKFEGSGSAFATSSASIPPSSGILCNGTDVATTWTVTSDATSATTNFTVVYGADTSEPCSIVTVEKVGNPSQTTVTSFGFNTCVSTGFTRVERVLQVNY